MARSIKENVEYFPFMCKEGKGMHYIQTKYKNDGYATWIKILRMLAVTNNHWMNLSNPIELMFLASTCLVTEQTLVSIIDDLAALEELDETLWKENRVIWSQKLVDSVQDAYSRRSNDCMTYQGLLLHLDSLGIRKLDKCTPEGCENQQSKVKYKKEKDSKVKEVELILPYNSETFKNTWDVLVRQPKWKKKSNEALLAAIHKLSKFDEAVSIQMMLNTIEGNWQGLFEIKGQQVLGGKKSGLNALKDYANGKQ